MSMQEPFGARPSRQLILRYALYLVGWAASIALGFFILLRLRLNLFGVIWYLQVNPWARAAVDKFSFVLLGLIWLSLILVAENYLRTAVPRNLLTRRLANVFGIEIAILAASFLLQMLLES
jgi:hypothetical protein